MLTTVITFAVVVSRKTSRCASTGKEMPTCECAELQAPVCLANSSVAVFWKRPGGDC